MPFTEVRPGKGRFRSDSLPEYTRYKDDGCDVSASCLDCPLPRCRYEEPGGLRALLNEQRDRQIIQLREKGMPVAELADYFGVSRRTVFRVIGTMKPPRKKNDNITPIPIRAERPHQQEEAHCA
jgi:hypothetical protein